MDFHLITLNLISMSLLYRPNENLKSKLVKELFFKLHDPCLLYFAKYFRDEDIVTDEFIEEKVVRKTEEELLELIEKGDSFWYLTRKNYRIDLYRKRSAHGKGDVRQIPLSDATELVAPLDLGLLDLEAGELLNLILCILMRDGQALSAKIIRMKTYDGMTRDEIIDELKGKRQSAVKAIRRAEILFKKVLCSLLQTKFTPDRATKLVRIFVNPNHE